MNEIESLPEEGARVKFRDKGCFVCGQSNPIGLHLKFTYDKERMRATASVTFQEDHQGWDAVVHGGLLAAVLDDVMDHAILTTGRLGITTRLTVTFREAVVVGEEVFLEGVVTELKNRIAKTKGTIFTREGDGIVVKCEAEGTYFLDAPRESSDG